VLARLAAIASIVLVATPALAQDGAYTEVDKRGRRIEKKAEGRAATRANRLLGFVRTWLGTPYL
jgi:predicted molibdopterin-dependent oxidoreductase YjgC